jgi:translation initiation factor IF-2
VSAAEGVMPQTSSRSTTPRPRRCRSCGAQQDRPPDATEANDPEDPGQLAEQGLNPVEWGGDTEVVKTSRTGQGIKELLEILDYQAQLMDLKADFERPAAARSSRPRSRKGAARSPTSWCQEAA